ncbi:M1 family metallopeptidase [Rhodocytophaga aerolata]|uniref:M1 family metallopeptidase n=1 Tax=Rhodocytophaga aerolata TaxID=455078 RepID=A0ABT8R1J3_9BACT|nr:M1 family metallopeptidase [Rhodocytophaga aerolata]MDO1445123.1 M1 family metallopeptidase [Rhodocytophaga aerolata]
MKKLILSIFLSFFFTHLFAQHTPTQIYTRYDSLRGTLSPMRSCYDVYYYDLNLRVNPAEQYIKGYNTIRYRTTEEFTKIQVDLSSNMKINRIVQHNQELPFERDSNAVFISFPQLQPKGILDSITIHYEGKPLVAANPPWDGGFTWEKDETGKDWIGVSCEGIGASLWWPNKDHLSEEPDSMRISCEVPSDLMCVANGNLQNTTKLNDGFTRYDWLVSYPINNYNVSLNIADYVHFSDTYTAKDGEKLALDYYVLRYNLEDAKSHFTQVKPMLECYEKLFGKYPFWKDGYALVETPYLGMEHQSAIAYGNNYLPGYMGMDLSGTGIGLTFDYLIIHESGHEYWGNSVSAQDHADMWIHESFCTYTEGLYIECMQNKESAAQYIVGLRQSIENKEPIIAPLHVNASGSGDMYMKGANVLHTLRNAINNDKLWFELIYGIAQEFKMKNTNTEEIVQYINQKTGKNYTSFFDQYLRHATIPTLQYAIKGKGKKAVVQYRWLVDVAAFTMPVKVSFGKGAEKMIYPTTQWQTLSANGIVGSFTVDTDSFYIHTQKIDAEKIKP